jgi:hypothetical protein
MCDFDLYSCYNATVWTDNPIWAALGFFPKDPHRFHYQFEFSNAVRGYGECRFTATAFGNLDNDATFSTYSRSGTIDARGSSLDEVEISLPCE